MTKIYDVIAEKYSGDPRPDIILFYDEDKETAIKFMREYKKKHGFSIYENHNEFSVANLMLRDRTSDGKELSRKSYIELFDIYGNRRKEEQAAG